MFFNDFVITYKKKIQSIAFLLLSSLRGALCNVCVCVYICMYVCMYIIFCFSSLKT
jgi:hypothetical protein